MASITLGKDGYVDILSSEAGPKRRPIRIVCFKGLTAAGDVLNSQFDASRHPVAFIDVTTGQLRAVTEFNDSGNDNGQLTQNDTGPGGHIIFSVWSDTGPQTSPGV